MPKPWRLTRQAEAALVEIARWTRETFGPRQAAAYEDDLIARCAEIAAGTDMSQDCRRIIDPDLPEDLRFARCGQHFVIFVEGAEQVIIVDFLHTRSDLPRRRSHHGTETRQGPLKPGGPRTTGTAMPPTRETILTALHTRLSALPASELSPPSGEFSFVSRGLVRTMALARMAASSARRSSVVSVSAGGAKAMSSCMGSEPPEAVCSMFAVRGGGIQVKTSGCRSGAKGMVAKYDVLWRQLIVSALQQ